MKPRSRFNTNWRVLKEAAAIAIGIILIVLAGLTGKPEGGQTFYGRSASFLPSRLPAFRLSSDNPRSQEGLARGKFLVASRSLKDPSFTESVVLLIEYDRSGAMGLVINRPSEVKLSKVFPQIKDLQERTDTVYIGGPVGRSELIMLVRSGSEPEKAHRIFNDIYISTSRTVLEHMIDDDNPGERFRVYAGHAGWAPGQLDQEVSRGAWHILAADSETVFNKPPAEIWPELIRRSSALWVRADPSTPLATASLRVCSPTRDILRRIRIAPPYWTFGQAKI